jgi:hypothetical protein
MTPASYDDFVVGLSRRSEQYWIDVTVPSQSKGWNGRFELPFDEREFSLVRAQVARAVTWEGYENLRDKHVADALLNTLINTGRSLSAKVFTPEVRALFHSHRALRGDAVRFRLKVDQNSPKLVLLPWELLIIPDERNDQFICLQMPFVREFLFGNGRTPHNEKSFRQNVVFIEANPTGTTPLNTDAEFRAIRRAMLLPAMTLSARILRMRNVSKEKLDDDLERHKDHLWALHFSGHGELDPLLEGGSLAIEDNLGKETSLDSWLFTTLITNKQALQLVVINACKSAQSVPSNVYSSIVASLLSAGVNAAVGMQFPIYDSSAQKFSKAFYRELARGECVDHAVFRARVALASDSTLFVKSLEWVTPVVYSAAGTVVRLRSRPVHVWDNHKGRVMLLGAVTIAALLLIIMLLQRCSLPVMLPASSLTSVTATLGESTASPNDVWAMELSTDGSTLWYVAGTENGLQLCSLLTASGSNAEPECSEQGEFLGAADPKRPISASSIRSMIMDENDNLWIAISEFGTLVYSTQDRLNSTWISSRTVENLEINNPYDIEHTRASDASQVTVWLGYKNLHTLTYSGAYPTIGANIAPYFPGQDMVFGEFSLFAAQGSVVRDLHFQPTKGILWVGTNNALLGIPTESNAEVMTFPTDNAIEAISEYDDTLWLISLDGNVYSLDSSNVFSPKFQTNASRATVDTTRGYIWLLSSCGSNTECTALSAIDVDCNRLLNFDTSIRLIAARDAVKDVSGMVWFATENGISVFSEPK